ncbi:hypothetical protein AWB61_21015 [Chromobacterium sp. F49]|nr:hypothetical protein Cv017_17880 [Chromobacterium subtsugae]KZE85118.1 hypothetical protein AWB61_21015 [Chromobacterium sp. F49]
MALGSELFNETLTPICLSVSQSVRIPKRSVFDPMVSVMMIMLSLKVALLMLCLVSTDLSLSMVLLPVKSLR